MSLAALSLLKAHVRADDFADDDAYLQHLLDTAEQHVADATNRSLADLVELGGGELPYSITHAVLLLAGHWYNQREAATTASTSAVPYAIDYLVAQFRKLV